MEIVDGVEVHVLVVPAEGGETHANVHPRLSDARNGLGEVFEQRGVAQSPQVPQRFAVAIATGVDREIRA